MDMQYAMMGMLVIGLVGGFATGFLFGYEKAWGTRKKLDEAAAKREREQSIEDRLRALERVTLGTGADPAP